MTLARRIILARWWLADRLRPNTWPSTAAQHGVLLEQIKELRVDLDEHGERIAQAKGEVERFRVRAMCAEFVLAMIAKGIPFRGQSDPREAARKYLFGEP